jgi:hypothetical protein
VTDLIGIATRVMEEWRRQHAEWDPAPFAHVTASAGAALAADLGDGPGSVRVVDAYLRLVAEALRLRYVDRASCEALSSGSPASLNLLGRCLLEVVPRRLPAYAAGKRLAILARVWNLGEGLLRQPPWMGRIASTLIRDVDDLERLGETISATLAPLMTEPRRSSFEGPFAVQVLDLRGVDDEFLPGPMHAAAPAILCVHDRLRQGVHGAVVLAAGGSSRSLGTTPCLAKDVDQEQVGGALEVRVAQGRATIGGRELPLPTVHTEHAHAMLASGYLAVSAVDSQRLWIVESAS